MENLAQKKSSLNQINKYFFGSVIFLIVVFCCIGYVLGKHAGEEKTKLSQTLTTKASTKVAQQLEHSLPFSWPQPCATSPCFDTGDGSYTIAINSEETRFVSPILGISFTYPKFYNEKYKGHSDPLSVSEKGNIVYIIDNYAPPYDPTYQEIYVFKKDPSISLAAAIEDQILPGISNKDCFVTTRASTSTNILSYFDNPSNYSLAAISYPTWDGSDVPNLKADKCPYLYTENSGLEIFVMDQTHPDRFFYLPLGVQGPFWSNFQVLQ
jgi:hypothetical protein